MFEGWVHRGFERKKTISLYRGVLGLVFLILAPSGLGGCVACDSGLSKDLRHEL